MKIKTVWEPMEFSEKFDGKVNDLLAEGWKLARREVLEPYPHVVYAELVKLDEADLAADLAELREAEPVTWQEAVDVLRETCREAEDCTKDGCPAFDWCQKNVKDDAPFINWSEPAE